MEYYGIVKGKPRKDPNTFEESGYMATHAGDSGSPHWITKEINEDGIKENRAIQVANVHGGDKLRDGSRPRPKFFCIRNSTGG